MIQVIITIAVAGLIVWAITTFVPMPSGFRRAIYAVAMICIVVFLLQAFGVMHGHDISVPQLK